MKRDYKDLYYKKVAKYQTLEAKYKALETECELLKTQLFEKKKEAFDYKHRYECKESFIKKLRECHKYIVQKEKEKVQEERQTIYNMADRVKEVKHENRLLARANERLTDKVNKLEEALDANEKAYKKDREELLVSLGEEKSRHLKADSLGRELWNHMGWFRQWLWELKH